MYTLNPFGKEDLVALLERAIQTDVQLSKKQIELKETEALLRLSGGDGRKLLNIFELLINSESGAKISITNDLVLSKVQKNTVLYDKTGEQHYDIISAFIKSIRGSDPNAAVYWLARMIEGGEDVKFIARRMIILASEDIGNANPTALVLAQHHVPVRYHHRFSRSADYSEPVCDLFGKFPKEQCQLHGHQRGTTDRSTDRRSFSAHGDPKCPDQINEGLGLWQRLRLCAQP